MSEKTCNNCGSIISGNVCWKCGAAYTDGASTPRPPVYPNHTQSANQPYPVQNTSQQANYQTNYQTNTNNNQSGGFMSESSLAAKNGVSATVKMKDWFVFDCISLLTIIPIVGALAALIIYIILAFNKGTAASIQSRIRLNLIISAIMLGISIIMVIIISIIAAAKIGCGLPRSTQNDIYSYHFA